MDIGWFSTGKSQVCIDTLRFVHDFLKSYDVNIAWVFSNTVIKDFTQWDPFEDFYNFVANDLKLPLITFSSSDYLPNLRKTDIDQWRKMYGSQLVKALNLSSVQFTVMFGYKLILSSVELGAGIFLNLHPALPTGPIGAWKDVIKSVIKNGDDVHGITVHKATEDLDLGPVIYSESFPIKGKEWDEYWKINRIGIEPLLLKIRSTGVEREPLVLTRAILKYLNIPE